MHPSSLENKSVVVIGGGPAGLMAAEVISAAGIPVDLYDAMPSPGRKFLLAGIGGLNLTHSETADHFVARYGARRSVIEPLLADFDAEALRRWAGELGIDTFVGSSGRVFPTGMKAAPLLRSWLHRLRDAGVRMHVRHRWLGWLGWRDGDASADLVFQTPAGEKNVHAHAVVLALGGGSWARLGSDAAWVPWLAARGVEIAPLLPANCGFEVPWTHFFRERFAGQPLKSIAAGIADDSGKLELRRGECVITAAGIEGSLIYALSSAIRERILKNGEATLVIDLLPDHSLERATSALQQPRGAHSFAKHLQQRVGIHGVKAALLREVLSAEQCRDDARVARTLKALPLRCTGMRPLDEAISTAGGVRFEALDTDLMLTALPGFFCAGEMLDWEAPTGGYLLTACFASGHRAGHGVLRWLRTRN